MSLFLRIGITPCSKTWSTVRINYKNHPIFSYFISFNCRTKLIRAFRGITAIYSSIYATEASFSKRKTKSPLNSSLTALPLRSPTSLQKRSNNSSKPEKHAVASTRATPPIVFLSTDGVDFRFRYSGDERVGLLVQFC